MNAVTRRPRGEAGPLRRRHHLGRSRRRDPGTRSRGARWRHQPHRRRRAVARRRHRLAQPQGRPELRQPRVGAGRDSPTAASSPRRRTEHPDLHWALRGGGGNFGVVTEFEFALHDVGPDRAGSRCSSSRSSRGGRGLTRDPRRARRPCPTTSAVQIVGLERAAGAVRARGSSTSRPGYMLAIVGWGSPEEHAAVVDAGARRGCSPSFELVTPIPYTMLQQMIDAAAPWGILGYEKAIYLDELTDAAVAVVAEQLRAQGVADVDHAGVRRSAAPTRRSPTTPPRSAGAARPSGSSTSPRSRPSPSCSRSDRAWVREFFDALVPFSSNSGGYVNFIADVDDDRVRTVVRRREVRPPVAHQDRVRPRQRLPPQREHQTDGVCLAQLRPCFACSRM